MKKKNFSFNAKLWVYPGETANWHFLTVPKSISSDIKTLYGSLARGWGSFPISVTIGKTNWKTSIFPDTKAGTYLLPIKKHVRSQEGLFEHDKVSVKFEILV